MAAVFRSLWCSVTVVAYSCLKPLEDVCINWSTAVCAVNVFTS